MKTIDQEDLAILSERSEWTSMKGLMRLLLEGMREDVLSVDIMDGNYSELAIRKARYDGARMLVNRIETALFEAKKGDN